MKIGAIGYNHKHDSSFSMDRPNGVGCRLMLLIKEHSVFELGGKKYDVQPASFVAISPEISCKY